MDLRKKICKLGRGQRQRQRRQLKNDADKSSDWAGVPDGLLEVIIERLPLIDCIVFSYVCKPWRRVFVEYFSRHQTCGFPFLLMPNQQEKEKEMRSCFSLLENQVCELEIPQAYGRFCWGSYQDWLIIVRLIGIKDVDHPFDRHSIARSSIDFSLLNPFSGRKIDLPQASNMYHKMVVSGLPSEENLVCMLVPGYGNKELAFWVPGSQSWHQLWAPGAESCPFEDAIFHNGNFYLLTLDYNILEIDATSVVSTIRRDDTSIDNASKIKTKFHEVEIKRSILGFELRYLVECCGDLLLIKRVFDTEGLLVTRDFEIYKLDFSHKAWMKLENLGDRMLFLGKCCSRSFSAKQLGVGMSNCIYFSNDRLCPWLNEWDDIVRHSKPRKFENYYKKHWGTFMLDNENRGSFCFCGKHDCWAPIWLTAPLWWYSTRNRQ